MVVDTGDHIWHIGQERDSSQGEWPHWCAQGSNPRASSPGRRPAPSPRIQARWRLPDRRCV